MIGPEVQKAIYAALMADPAIASGNVFDQVPDSDPFPRVTIGDAQVIDDGNSCEDGWEVYSDIHVWSRPDTGSKVEVKTIGAQIVERIVNGSLTVEGFNIIAAQLDAYRTFRDPDGETEHTVMTIRHSLEPA
jgi:hypothetical protein